MVFNATFSNISAISWQPVLVVEEARVPGEIEVVSFVIETGRMMTIESVTIVLINWFE
jgi:hypothetical protein